MENHSFFGFYAGVFKSIQLKVKEKNRSKCGGR